MKLKFKKKKIALSFNDFANFEFNNFISKLAKKNDITLFSNQNYPKQLKKIKLKFIYLQEKKNIFIEFLKFFSKTKSSSLQNFYYVQNILNRNFLLKIIFFVKYIFNRFGLLIDINLIRKIFLKYNKNFINFDYLITDFRYSEIYTNHSIVNFCKKKKIPIIVLIFSWDNLYSEDVNLDGDFYFVSSKEMKKILNKRHKIPFSKIFFTRSFQFSYISKKNKYYKKKNYLLYSCCVEDNSKIIDEEFKIINHVGRFLIKNKIDYKIYVRPYPFFEKKINFKKKLKYPNIYIKNYGQIRIRRRFNKKTTYVRYEENYMNKMKLLKEAKIHINFFSTIGIESMLIKTNTLFLNLEKKFNLINYKAYFKSNYFKSKFLDHFGIFEKKNMFIKNFNELDIILLKNLKNNDEQKIPKNYKFFKNFFLNK